MFGSLVLPKLVWFNPPSLSLALALALALSLSHKHFLAWIWGWPRLKVLSVRFKSYFFFVGVLRTGVALSCPLVSELRCVKNIPVDCACLCRKPCWFLRPLLARSRPIRAAVWENPSGHTLQYWRNVRMFWFLKGCISDSSLKHKWSHSPHAYGAGCWS